MSLGILNKLITAALESFLEILYKGTGLQVDTM